MLTFTDQWGLHEHEMPKPRTPYDPNKPITCQSCISRLNISLYAWLDKLTIRENLPENFWVGYKFPWSDE